MKRLVFLMILFGLVAALPAAAQDEEHVYATAQRYDSGLMIWRSDTGTIWVLADDGRALDFPPSAYATLPDNPIFGTPPDRLRPIMGMGKVWGNYALVRQALGWPTLNELGFQMPVRSASGTMYFTQLDGTVIQINANHTWLRTAGEIPAPHILAFTATPDPVTLGETVTLHWQVQGTESVLIEVSAAGRHLAPDQIIDNLPLMGSTAVTIPARYDSGVHFVIWGVNHSRYPAPVTLWEHVVSQELTVGVGLNPGPFVTQAAFQQYEHGFLIWRADNGEVMVFGGGGPLMRFGEGGYAAWPDPVDIDIPPERVRPINAFGKVWGNVSAARSMLGFAVGQEQGFQMTIQNLADGSATFTLPDSRTAYVADNAWHF